MEIKDPNTGQIKMWVWAVGALGFVVVLFLFSKLAGGGQQGATGTIPADGQSSDITEYLAQIQEALEKLQDTSEPTDPPDDPDDPDDPPDPPTPRTLVNYTVRQGDTWRSIAEAFGMTMRQFFKKNPTLKSLGTPDQVRSGGRIVKVFERDSTGNPNNTVVVARGDTWREIVSRAGITLQQFYNLNPTLDTRKEKNPDRERSGGRTVIIGTSNT